LRYLCIFRIQANVGLFYGVRVGISLAEFADFLLGWTTFDILHGDDQFPPHYPRTYPCSGSPLKWKCTAIHVTGLSAV
jgi:hypothetical protein